MINEEKQILLKDLVARLPYTPMVNIKEIEGYNRKLISFERNYSRHEFTVVVNSDEDEVYCPHNFSLDEVKPYLRPMSSMTEEEKIEYDQLCYNCQEQDSVDYNITELDGTLLVYVIDWLNAHHFDYRGLIEKGLALEAPEGMYNLKEK